MIKSFRCRDTEALANDEPVKRFRAIERAARRKLEVLASAERLDGPAEARLATGSRPSRATGRVSTAFASTTSGAFAFAGMTAPRTWRSSTTTDSERRRRTQSHDGETRSHSSWRNPAGGVHAAHSASAKTSSPVTSTSRCPHQRHHPCPARHHRRYSPQARGLFRHHGRVLAEPADTLRSQDRAADSGQGHQQGRPPPCAPSRVMDVRGGGWRQPGGMTAQLGCTGPLSRLRGKGRG